MTEQASHVYDDLVGGDESQWAFGSAAEDPLAGLDVGVPAGLDAAALARYCLALGDDALVYAHRLSEWTSNAPDLEEDVALANIALDLLGQARLLLSRAAAADASLVPVLPPGSPVPPEDALAFFRDADTFANSRFVEPENGDFAVTITRLVLFSTHRLALFQQLVGHPDPVLAAVAAKGVKELTYHRDYAARWFVTLARGTEESHRRLLAALALVWPTAGTVVAGAEVQDVLDQVFTAAGLDRPPAPPPVDGAPHTDALAPLLAEMQSVARAHPLGRW